MFMLSLLHFDSLITHLSSYQFCHIPGSCEFLIAPSVFPKNYKKLLSQAPSFGVWKIVSQLSVYLTFLTFSEGTLQTLSPNRSTQCSVIFVLSEYIKHE